MIRLFNISIRKTRCKTHSDAPNKPLPSPWVLLVCGVLLSSGCVVSFSNPLQTDGGQGDALATDANASDAQTTDAQTTDGGLLCGNDVLDSNELCDGSDFGGQTCLSGLGLTQGTLSCTTDCLVNYTDCYTCGNANVEGPEMCDGPNLGGNTCAQLGATGGSLSCTSLCELDLSGCFTCGDGFCETTKGELPDNCHDDCGWTIVTLADSQYSPWGIAVDSTHVFWANSEAGEIKRVAKSGGTVDLLASNQDDPTGVNVIDNHVYWSNAKTDTGSIAWSIPSTPTSRPTSETPSSAFR